MKRNFSQLYHQDNGKEQQEFVLRLILKSGTLPKNFGQFIRQNSLPLAFYLYLNVFNLLFKEDLINYHAFHSADA